MPYVICGECGGYYELLPGESADDFQNCNCGGSLSYIDKIEKAVQNKPKYICTNCLEENEEGIFCSNCGGKIIKIDYNEQSNNINQHGESKEIEKLSNYNKNDIYDIPKVPRDLVKRISVLGLILGIGTFIILFISSVYVIFLVLTMYGPTALTPSLNTFNDTVYFMFLIGIFIMIVISGVITTYFSRTRVYFDGILNGIILGLICGILVHIVLSNWDLYFILFSSISGAIGGFGIVWLKK